LFQSFKDILRSIHIFDLQGNNQFKAVGMSYMISFLVICSYGLIKNLLDFKLFILVISLSQVIYHISRQEKGSSYELD
jgi:hypothetical protein